MKVDIYTARTCSYCAAAKQLLKTKGINFREIDVSNDENLRMKIIKQTGHRTVPQIFIDQSFIGGFQELNRYLAKPSF